MSSQLVTSTWGIIMKHLSRQSKNRQINSHSSVLPTLLMYDQKQLKVSLICPVFRGQKYFFTNAGAESNENAIKLAKLYTGKWKILSMQRCYHGSTAGAGGLSGEPRHFANEPGDAGHVHFEGPYPYYAPAEVKFRSEDDVADYYLELLKRVVQTEGAHQIAAIFVESVVGSNGILIPPAKYMQGIRKLCTENNIVMVCDEVMAGFYRTGKPFAFQNFDIQPDLVTFAKGCTCGYVQLGGVIMNKKIAHSFDMTPMQCGLTYSAHPIGCACTCAALREYKKKISKKM